MKSLIQTNKIKTLSLISILFIISCSNSENETNNSYQKQSLLSVLFVQKSPEHVASSIQAYQIAKIMLEKSLKDIGSSASIFQNDNYEDLPPAIILDIDETVLDNSPYQARAIKGGFSYPRNWIKWVNEASAANVPGVKEFIEYAISRDINIFYISNRVFELEDATRVNFKKNGIIISEPKNEDRILLRNENNWTSDKTERIKLVSKNYRIIMIVGDQLSDFIGSTSDLSLKEQNDLSLKKYKNMWGNKWIVLENPIYGSWNTSIYNNDFSLSEDEITKARIDALEDKPHAK